MTIDTQPQFSPRIMSEVSKSKYLIRMRRKHWLTNCAVIFIMPSTYRQSIIHFLSSIYPACAHKSDYKSFMLNIICVWRAFFILPCLVSIIFGARRQHSTRTLLHVITRRNIKRNTINFQNVNAINSIASNSRIMPTK